MKILKIILSQVSKQPYANTKVGDIQHLISKIINFLQDKMYESVGLDIQSTLRLGISVFLFFKLQSFKITTRNDVIILSTQK
ncbi:hypothetical protein PR202_ga20766 [Eleusine coracana subsp. coracana]|uniref:Uncharacterized protein n=1 Tax=Eleusine coracana subsp. coracana TaxID=191504 RepID=A0AAV5CZ47_ELECO|nr:hypothetical protein PR202_ga20766 [Eleusine coracana subsp. coracana]